MGRSPRVRSEGVNSTVRSRRLGPVGRMAHGAIRLYQLVTQNRPTPCRYVPTCSHYGLEALEEHGLARGGWLTLRRLGRCTPWARSSGWDPVPRPKSAASSVGPRGLSEPEMNEAVFGLEAFAVNARETNEGPR